MAYLLKKSQIKLTPSQNFLEEFWNISLNVMHLLLEHLLPPGPHLKSVTQFLAQV